MCDALEKVGRTINAAHRLALRKEPSKKREIDSYFENELTVTTYAPRQCGETDKPVVLGDWNGDRDDWSYARHLLCEHLERLGVGLEWCDQYTTCSNCYRAIQTQPDCYSWVPEYVIMNGDILCPDCWDEGEILEALEGDENKCLQVNIDPEQYGYELIEGGFESGFFEGQTDDPRKIAKALRDQGIKRFLFVLNSTGQFDARFSVWRKKEGESEDE